MKSLLGLAVVLAPVVAQDIFSAVPACAIPCEASAILAAPCALTNLACQCARAAEKAISAAAAPCIATACVASQRTKATAAAAAVCSSFRAGSLPSIVKATRSISIPTVTAKKTTAKASTTGSTTGTVSAKTTATSDEKRPEPTTTSPPDPASTAAQATSTPTDDPLSSTTGTSTNAAPTPIWAIVLTTLASIVLLASLVWLVFSLIRRRLRRQHAREDPYGTGWRVSGGSEDGDLKSSRVGVAAVVGTARGASGSWLRRLTRRSRRPEEGGAGAGQPEREVHELGNTGPYARLSDEIRGGGRTRGGRLVSEMENDVVEPGRSTTPRATEDMAPTAGGEKADEAGISIAVTITPPPGEPSSGGSGNYGERGSRDGDIVHPAILTPGMPRRPPSIHELP